MALFSQRVRPAESAIGIGGKRHSIFQSVFPNLPHGDVTGMFSNPAMIPHLPARPSPPPAPAAPAPKTPVSRALNAVSAHLATYPKPATAPSGTALPMSEAKDPLKPKSMLPSAAPVPLSKVPDDLAGAVDTGEMKPPPDYQTVYLNTLFPTR